MSNISSLWVNQVFDLDPADELRILCMDRVFGNIQPYELFALMTVAKACHARNVFEIGTFNGRTTRNLAANIGQEGTVYTLDLEPEVELDQLKYDLDDLETSLLLRESVGQRYRETPEAARIVQYFGDSAKFDYSKHHGDMDLVFIDGSHALDYVRSDTENALQMVTPKSGIIVWHDYGDEFPDVREYLNDLAEASEEYDFFHMLHTLMVVAVAKDSKWEIPG